LQLQALSIALTFALTGGSELAADGDGLHAGDQRLFPAAQLGQVTAEVALPVAIVKAILWPTHDVAEYAAASRAAHLQKAREAARTPLLTLGAGSMRSRHDVLHGS